MDSYFEVHVTDGRKFTFPVTEVSGKEFFADQPARAEALVVTEVRLFSDSLDSPVRFVLDSLSFVEEEAGVWTVSVTKDKLGIKNKYHLEYYATSQFGEEIRHPTVLSWDHKKDHMVVD